MMLWNRFKKFDAYVKTVDGVNQQTLLGAIITIVSAILVSILLFSEIILYAKVDVVSRMATDKIGGVESVRLKFDIEFQGISCNRINFQQEVTRGNLHLHEPGQIEKRDIPIETMTGCSVSGNMITDKVGGNFRFHINSAPNAVNDMSQPIPAVRGEDQALPKLDHKINHVSFNHVSLNEEDEKQAYQIIPGLTNSLNDQLTVVADDTNIYHYAIQIVPTQYRAISGKVYSTSQYSFSEKPVLTDPNRPTIIAGVPMKEFNGVVFTYDFHPVMVIMEERREVFIDFISNLFGIIGGVITVISLLESVLHQSTKVLIGKKD